MVEGGIEDTFSHGGYLVAGDYWGKFANPGERFVCDKCMWSNPRYIKVYGMVKLG